MSMGSRPALAPTTTRARMFPGLDRCRVPMMTLSRLTGTRPISRLSRPAMIISRSRPLEIFSSPMT